MIIFQFAEEYSGNELRRDYQDAHQRAGPWKEKESNPGVCGVQ